MTLLILVLTIPVVFLGQPAHAQSYLVHQYGADTDLPHATVYGMTQGLDGRIWFATHNGIAVYDGQEWTSYINPTDLPAGRFSHICTDHRGQIWAASPGVRNVLSVFDGQSWTSRTGPEELIHDHDLELTGLAVLETETGEAVLLGTLSQGLWLLSGESWQRIDFIAGSRIRSLAAGLDRFFVAAEDGLATVSADGSVDTTLSACLPADGEMIHAIQPVYLPEGTDSGTPSLELWILTDRWIGCIRDNVLEIAARRTMKWNEQYAILPVLEVQAGRAVFYANRYDLYRLDLKSSQVERLGRSSGLNNEGASDLLEDREGNLWVSGFRGVSKIASMRFGNLRSVHGLLEDEVTAICEPRDGTLIFGHNHGITIRENGHLEKMILPNRLSHQPVPPRILDLFADSDGTVWLAGSGAGLGRLFPSGEWQWFEFHHGVNAVLRDAEGRLLAGTSAGVYEFDEGRFILTPFIDPLLSVRRMFNGADGSLYMANIVGGLYRWQNGRTEKFRGLESTAARDVYSMLEDRQGRLWVGTKAGLHVLKDGHLVRPDEVEPGLTNAVFFILQDEAGELWFGTDDGLFRWNGSTLLHYTVRDGLAGRETNRAAGLVDHSGRLWVGTDSGVSVYQKELERESTPPPLVQLDHLLAGESRYDLLSPLSLDHRSNTLEFHYRAVSFVDERAVLYTYRLEGFEENWCDPVPAGHRSVRYTNLPPGRYRFLLSAANADDVWSTPLASQWITVRKPIWGHWWFYLICALLSGLVIYWAGAAVLRHRYTIRLESEVQARTAELADSEGRYRLLFDNAAVAKLLIDPGPALVLEANESACRLLGMPRGQLVGSRASMSSSEWLHEFGCLIEADPDRTSLEFSSLQQQVGKDALEVEVKATRLIIKGRPRVLALIQDVTESRRSENERLRASKLESLGLLAGGIAHDFNNFLTGILGNISLARRCSARGEDVTELLDEAEKSVPRAKHLTGQLLTFARGGAPVKRPLHMGEISRSVASFALTGSGINCTYDVEEALWPVEADEGQIGQVVSNLVINAVQASNRGEAITLTVKNCDLEQGNRHGLTAGPHVRLSVEDEGEGIAGQILERIFDPYFSTRDTGSGLGLATVYSIVTRHHGAVDINSIPGEGTTAVVHIPASPDAIIETEESETLELTGKGRVLAMDDEQSLRRYYRRVLTYLGYQPETVPDGESAINLYLEAVESGRPFDVVILDLTIPGGMGGEETLRILKQEDPDVKAIVSSGYSNDPVMANHREYGFCTLLTKPASTNDLARALKGALDPQNP